MDGHEVFRHAIARMEQACREVLAQAGLGLDDVDLVVPHQANGRMTVALRERLGLPADRVADDIAGRGNTSAATIPLALQAAADAGRLPTEGRVLLCAFGAGFAWGAALVHFGAAGPRPA
jgi:3-oxoacyl-[acyl-carrier-protein] synthase-3